MTLPRFTASHQSLSLKPPFRFEGLTTRVFPLRARVTALQEFVDQYLNVIPKEVGRFRAFLPYVHLMVLDYGKLALALANTGWLSQQEILFGIPVEWHRVRRGRWEFEGWAWVTPFIFVDSDVSLTLGRTVIGWPKLLAVVSANEREWLRNPRGPLSLATVSTMVYPKIYAGAPQQMEPFLQIERRPPTPVFDVPPDMRNPLMPWTLMGDAARTWESLMRDAMAFAGARPAFRWPAAAGMGTLNLKQFRDASHPADYCYQSLTLGRMDVTGFNGGGLLRDTAFLGFDASGGYTVRLYRWPSLPIVETLGLEVEREHRGDGVTIAELSPVFPFWYDVDMKYERARNLAWRGPDRVWHGENGRRYEPPAGDESARYNTTLGQMQQAASGALAFSSSIMRVLPLLADRRKVEAFLDDFLNAPLNTDCAAPVDARFELWAAQETPHCYVYLVATSYGRMTAAANNVGSTPSQAVMFLIPVRLKQRAGDGWVLRSLGFVPALNFMDTHAGVMTASEVQGLPTVKSTFESPPNTWMSDPSGRHRHSVLAVSSEVLPSLNLGQEVQKRVVLEIFRGEIVEAEHDPLAPIVAEQWGPLLLEELERKRDLSRDQGQSLRRARALALEILANELPWNVFTLKQFRDAAEPDRACYQSVEALPRFIERLESIDELEEPLHVRVHEYPSQPIVSLLGLVATQTSADDGSIAFLLRPVRPFALELSWKHLIGARLWHRSGSNAWSGDLPEPGFFSGDMRRRTGVGESLADLLDDHAPCELRDLVRQWSAEWPDRLSVADAAEALDLLDFQSIVESIISREWSRPAHEARWSRARRGIEYAMEQRLRGIATATRATEEARFIREMLATLRMSQQQLDALEPRVGTLEALAGIVLNLNLVVGSGEQQVDNVAIHASLAPLESLHSVNVRDQRRLDSLRADVSRAVDSNAKARVVLERVDAAFAAQRDTVLHRFSTAAQKPDYCLPRSLFGWDERDVFPRAASWDDDWFAGAAAAPAPRSARASGRTRR